MNRFVASLKSWVHSSQYPWLAMTFKMLSSEKKLCFLLGSALTARMAFRIGYTKHMSWPESTKKPNHVLIVTLIPNFLWPIHKWVIPDRKLRLLNDWGWNCLDFNQKKEEEGKNVKNGKGFVYGSSIVPLSLTIWDCWVAEIQVLLIKKSQKGAVRLVQHSDWKWFGCSISSVNYQIEQSSTTKFLIKLSFISMTTTMKDIVKWASHYINKQIYSNNVG